MAPSPQPVTFVQPPERTVGQRYQPLVLMLAVTLAFLGAIGGRLAYLQLIQGRHHRELATTTRVRLVPLPPSRGQLLDTQGRVLASNRVSYSVFVWPVAQPLDRWQVLLPRLAMVLQVPPESLSTLIDRVGYASPQLVRVARGVSPSQMTAIAELSAAVDGIEVAPESVREYPLGDLAAHTIGYTRQLRTTDLDELSDEGYQPGDDIGEGGLEAVLEDLLRGKAGGRQVEVDPEGEVLRVLGEKPAQSGNDVQLTLDIPLQRVAETALGDEPGAIVALEPNSGKVLALASRPGFDPNLFSTHLDWRALARIYRADLPLVNRALQPFPLAGAMKLPTTAAAIASRQFTPRQRLSVSPSQRLGGASFVATRDRTQVRLGFQGAIAHPGSLSDAFFEQVAVSVGGPALVAWGQKFGIGRRSGIELAEDEPDTINQGHDVWNALARQEDWYVGNTTQLALGQGSLAVSPLQAAIMLSVPANGGYRVQPHLVADRSAAAAREHLNLSPRTLTLMQQALVDSAAANSHLTATATLPVAGQGGVIRRENGQTIAWFGAYAPIDKPAAVVVALVENPSNRDHAERTVRQTLAAYLDPQGIPNPSTEIPVSIP